MMPVLHTSIIMSNMAIVGIADSNASYGKAVAQQELQFCIQEARKPIDPDLLLSILIAEGGRNGAIVKNKNGSFDLGVGQINTIQYSEPWFTVRYPNWNDVAFDTCTGVEAAADILLRRMSELNIGQSVWEAVGHYNSKTGSIKIQYLQRVMQIYTNLSQNKGTDFKPSMTVTYQQKNFFTSGR